MIIHSEGILLKYTLFKENSAIIEVFTASKGLLTFMVSGLNRKKNTFKKAYLYPLAYLDIVFYYKENQNIKRIKEAKIQEICLSLNTHIAKISISQFFAEVLRKSLHEDADEDLFGFLVQLIRTVEKADAALLNHLPPYFLIRLAQYLGVGIFQEDAPISIFKNNENLNHYLGQLLSGNLADLQKIALSKSDRQEVLEQLIHYYEVHLPHLGKISSHEKWKAFFAL